MDAVFDESVFSDFGDDALYPFDRTGLCSVESPDTAELRKEVREFVPRDPGVYGMLDPLGRLIYVGKSKCLRNRLLSYFLPNNEEDKAGRIVQSTHTIVWETQPSEFAALVREQFLIRQFRPRFNVQGIPRRQQRIYVCLGRQPAEQFYTSRNRDPNAIVTLGPLSGASRASRAVEVLNRVYKLRDCSSKQPCSFTDQLQLFDIEMRPGCIRLEIESCLGPCISACSRGDYDRQVDHAKSFLQGESDAPIIELQILMQRAVENLHFEQAAAHREDLRAIQWLHGRTVDIANAREHFTFVYPIESHKSCGNGRPIWYLIRRGTIEGAISAPRSAEEGKQVRARIKEWLALDGTIGSGYQTRPETLALVSSWFRKHRGELKRTFLPGDHRSRKHFPRSAGPSSAKKAPTIGRRKSPKATKTPA